LASLFLGRNSLQLLHVEPVLVAIRSGLVPNQRIPAQKIYLMIAEFAGNSRGPCLVVEEEGRCRP
jgi:hypothetical protein